VRYSYLISCFILAGFSQARAQGVMRQTYHDPEKKNLKEVYQVKDTIRNVLHGRYISYYLNGKIESKGQFENNETTGVWEFYFETGKLKMRGILFKSSNYGLWEYFYESGQKSMEGIIYGRNREGEWKSYYENGQIKEVGEYKDNHRTGPWKAYYEDGVLKGEADYTDDFGRYTEYYHSGKILGEGPKSGTRQTGHWRYFAEDGTLESEGDYDNGRKTGLWTTYYSSGKVSGKGNYVNDLPTGAWEYYFEDGKVSSTGEFKEGKKNGHWKTMNPDGSVKSEVTLNSGNGEFREYYPSGKLKSKGLMVDGKKQGRWEYYFEDGKLEGECQFDKGKGMYHGYYANGNLQTKGMMEDDLKTGTWEIYEKDGKLSGYYKPFYDDRKLGKEIAALAGKSSYSKKVTKAKRFAYFDERAGEFRGVIFGTNPVWLAVGRLPLGIEFYLQERLGHEFEFIGIRDPFFKADLSIPAGKKFERGYSISIKQKFYNPVKAGMWYFGHELRFTNLGHFVNEPITQNPSDVFTFNAVEQRIEYGPLLGYRIMQRHNIKGFTIDAFVSYNIGYRGFDVDPNFSSYFEDINQSRFSNTFHFGLNLGQAFSFR
jgi:antitoxin component YwqK of YwqJK toxin-antitoxin module